MGELPLVLFTVLSQLAVGALVTLWLLDSFTNKIDLRLGKLTALTIAAIGGLGVLLSLFHLGHPLNAYRAFANLGSSWLSREILFFTLFLIMSVIYFLQWKEANTKNRKIIGGITVLIALLAVISSGMAYVLPARPAWNNLSPIIFFIITAALLGPLYVGALFKLKGKHIAEILPTTAIIIVLSLISFGVYISMLFSGQEAAYLSGVNLFQNKAFWLRAVIGWLIPLAILLTLGLKRIKTAKNLVIYIFILTLIGEFIGRELFYSTTIALQVTSF